MQQIKFALGERETRQAVLTQTGVGWISVQLSRSRKMTDGPTLQSWQALPRVWNRVVLIPILCRPVFPMFVGRWVLIAVAEATRLALELELKLEQQLQYLGSSGGG